MTAEDFAAGINQVMDRYDALHRENTRLLLQLQALRQFRDKCRALAPDLQAMRTEITRGHESDCPAGPLLSRLLDLILGTV